MVCKVHWPTIAMAGVLVVACGDDGDGSAVSDGSETGTATDDTTGGETGDTGPGTTGSMDTETGDTTEGGPEICGIDEGDAPGFTMSQGGTPVPETDANIEVSCGGQGAFMFYFPVDIVGVDPGSDDQVPFTFSMDVDGMNTIEGEHFIDRNVFLYVGCEEPLDGPDPSSFNVVLPDQVLDDPTVLDGLSFSMEVVMMPGSTQEVGFSSEGVISAANDGDWDWCFDFGDDDDDDDTDGGTTGETGGETEGETEGDTGGTTGTTG